MPLWNIGTFSTSIDSGFYLAEVKVKVTVSFAATPIFEALWSMVQHKLPGFADNELLVTVVAPCDQAPH